MSKNKYLLILVILGLISFAFATNIEVSQPTQITSNEYYERGNSVVKDGSGNYWVFYGRSDEFTGNYSTGSPDNDHYSIYYKTATSINGLVSAIPQLLPNQPTGIEKIFQGQTAATVLGGDVYVFATKSIGTEIVYWKLHEGTWSAMQNSGFVGFQIDVTTHGGKIWLSYIFVGATNTYVASYDGSSWSSEYAIQGTGSINNPITRFYENSAGKMILYFINGWAIVPNVYYFYEYDDVAGWPLTPTATLSITEPDTVQGCDPLLTQVNGNGDYFFVRAPLDNVHFNYQWLSSRRAATLADLQTATTRQLTNGGYIGMPMVDMWPRTLTDGGNVYMFFGSERAAGNETERGTGNIWMYKLDWNLSNDHSDYIQPAINFASTGDAVGVAAGVYNENVDVNKSITLAGASSATVAVYAKNASAHVFNITASNVEITGFTAIGAVGTGTMSYAGMNFTSGVTNCNIHDNILTVNEYGILIVDPENTAVPGNNIFTNNIAANNSVSGIEMQHSYGNIFTRNRSNSNTKYGFKLDGVSHNTFTGNTANSNLDKGFYLVQGSSTNGCEYNTFTNDTANLNTRHGIHLIGLNDNIVLTGNTFDGNLITGIKLQDIVTNLTIRGNNITNNPTGINIDASVTGIATWTVTNNNIAGNTTGVTNNTGAKTLVNAEYNWWGSNTGPYHATLNPTGGGNAVSDNVDFIPWLPPLAPTLISPTDGSHTYDQTPTFSWSDVTGAASFNLVVSTATKTDVINIVTADLSYTPISNIPGGTYTWQVRSKGLFGDWSSFSDAWTLIISPFPAGWSQAESMPSQVSGKYVADGGALVTVGGTKDGDVIYAFRGKSREFYKYIPGTPGVWTWLQNDSIPNGVKPTDPLKINKKVVAKGASMCFDGNHTIYATKGNGTKEFWAYNISESTWTAKAFVNVPKGLKGGTSIIWFNGKVYLLAGNQKKTDPSNFFIYDPVGDTTNGLPWTALASLGLGPKTKVWKDGACITELNGVIYAMKSNDKPNYFFAYDTGLNTWTELVNDTIPPFDYLLTNGVGKLKKVYVKDGAAMANDGSAIYATKGGGYNFMWKYIPTAGWSRVESVPRLCKKSVIKTGGAMTYANGAIWLLKGNKSPEFWRYVPTAEMSKFKTQISNINTQEELVLKQIQDDILLVVTPNLFSNLTTIHYTVPISGRVTIKLYNATGQAVKTINDGYLNIGTYTANLSANSFAKGVYFLRYSDNTNQKEIKLIVE